MDEGFPMVSMMGCGGSANQHGVGDKLLQMGSRAPDVLQTNPPTHGPIISDLITLAVTAALFTSSVVAQPPVHGASSTRAMARLDRRERPHKVEPWGS